MGFLDVIKKGVIEEFSGSISTVELCLSLFTALVAALIVNFVYRKTYTGVSYTRSFSLSIILLAMVTSLVIRTINSNLALSLGMVGALSIVRFRTAVKDATDTIFMFLSITIGIMSGAGLYLITLIATLLLSIFYILSYMIIFKPNDKYLLVVKIKKNKTEELMNTLTKQYKCILKTESIRKDVVELTYEVSDKHISEDLIKWQENPDIENINLVNIN